MRSSRAWLGGMLLVALAWPRAADAKDEFPREIATHLGAQAAPPCGLCHLNAKTGGDTLITPFAWGMRARGLTDQQTLLGALDRVRSDDVDSDGDGTTDIDEIIAATDPNSAASTPATPGTLADPQLGCAVGSSSAPAAGKAGLTGATLLAVMLLRRRRRDPE
ncbi:MAG: hypothetical protein JWM82_1994 [Myxococcales bacterium]|nr:hypothetical protein [Myxococcales bacterium]